MLFPRIISAALRPGRIRVTGSYQDRQLPRIFGYVNTCRMPEAPLWKHFSSQQDQAAQEKLDGFHEQLKKSRQSYKDLGNTLQEMNEQSIQFSTYTYHVVLASYLHLQRLQDMLYWFRELKSSGLPVTTLTYNKLLDGCVRCGQPERAFRILEEMKLNGYEPDSKTYQHLLCAGSFTGDVERAQMVVSEMEEKGFEHTPVTFMHLMHTYAKQDFRHTDQALDHCRNLMEASRRFDEEGRIPESLYRSMIEACLLQNDYAAAAAMVTPEAIEREGVQLTARLVLFQIRALLGQQKYEEAVKLVEDHQHLRSAQVHAKSFLYIFESLFSIPTSFNNQYWTGRKPQEIDSLAMRVMDVVDSNPNIYMNHLELSILLKKACLNDSQLANPATGGNRWYSGAAHRIFLHHMERYRQDSDKLLTQDAYYVYLQRLLQLKVRERRPDHKKLYFYASRALARSAPIPLHYTPDYEANSKEDMLKRVRRQRARFETSNFRKQREQRKRESQEEQPAAAA